MGFKLVRIVSAFVCLAALIAHQSQPSDGLAVSDDDFEEELESELQLKRMLSYVTPLMAIVRSHQRIRRSPGNESSVELEETGRATNRNGYSGGGYGGGYGGYSSASSYGGGGSYGGCCNQKDDLLPLLALLGLAGLLLYLVLIASTTTTRASGRKRRSYDDQGNELPNYAEDDEGIQFT